MIRIKELRDFAERCNYEIIENQAIKGNRIIITLRARFEYKDGYRPRIDGLTRKEAWAYLRGFTDVRTTDQIL